MFSRKKKTTPTSKRGGKKQATEVAAAQGASPSGQVAIRSTSSTTAAVPKAPPRPNALPWLLRVPKVPENIRPSKAQRLLSGKAPITESTLSPRLPWLLKVPLPTKGKKPSEALDELPRKRSKSLAGAPLPWILRVPLPKLGQPPSQLLKSSSRRRSITTIQEHLRNKPGRDFELPWILQVPKPRIGQKPSEFKQFKSTCLRNRASDTTLPWILRVPTPKCGEKPSSFRFCARRKKPAFQLPWILSVPLPKCGQKPSELNRKKSYVKELPWLKRVPLPKRGARPCDYVTNKSKCRTKPYSLPWLLTVPLPKCGQKPSTFFYNSRRCSKDTTIPWILRVPRAKIGKRPSGYTLGRKSYKHSLPWILRVPLPHRGQTPCYFRNKKQFENWKFSLPWLLRVPLPTGTPSEFLQHQKEIRQKNVGIEPWILRVNRPVLGFRPSLMKQKTCWLSDDDTPWLLRVPQVKPGQKPSDFCRKTRSMKAFTLPWLLKVPRVQPGRKPSDFLQGSRKRKLTDSTLPWMLRVPLPHCCQKPSEFLGGSAKRRCIMNSTDRPWLLRVPLPFSSVKPSQFRTLYPSRMRQFNAREPLPWICRVPLPKMGQKPSQIKQARLNKLNKGFQKPWITRVPLPFIGLRPSLLNRDWRKESLPLLQRVPVFPIGTRPSQMRETRPRQTLWQNDLPWLLQVKCPAPNAKPSSIPKSWKQKGKPIWNNELPWLARVPVSKQMIPSKFKKTATARGMDPKTQLKYLLHPGMKPSTYKANRKMFKQLTGSAMHYRGIITERNKTPFRSASSFGKKQENDNAYGSTNKNYVSDITVHVPSEASRSLGSAALATGPQKMKGYGGFVSPISSGGMTVAQPGFGRRKSQGYITPRAPPPSFEGGVAGGVGAVPRDVGVSAPLTGTTQTTAGVAQRGVTPTTGVTAAGIAAPIIATGLGGAKGISTTQGRGITPTTTGGVTTGTTAPSTTSRVGGTGITQATTSRGGVVETGMGATDSAAQVAGVIPTTCPKEATTTGVPSTSIGGVTAATTTAAVPSTTTGARSVAGGGAGAAPGGAGLGGIGAAAGAGAAAAGIGMAGATGGAGGVGTGAGAGTGARGATLASQIQEGQCLYDTIVIGGGISGLTAAYTVLQQCPNAKVLVLEGTSQIGGRIKSMPLPSPPCPAGTSVDVGATWFGPAHTNILSLLKQLNIDVFQQFSKGKKIFQDKSKKKLYDQDTTSTLGSISKFDTSKLYAKVKKLSDKVHRLPTKKAAELDNTSFHDWTSAESWTKSSFDSLDLAVEWIFGTTPRNLSTLYALNIFHSAGGNVKRMMDKTGGAMSYRVVGGMPKVCNALYDCIKKAGGDVRFNSLVGAIDLLDNDAMRVGTNDNAYCCKNLIFATPLSSLYKITCNFSIPDEYIKLSMNMFMGSYIRIIAVYKEPFWREANLSGEAVINSNNYQREPISFVIDYSDHLNQVNALCVTITADRAAHWGGKPEPERRAAILHKLGLLFGTQASNPICYLEYDWNNDPVYKGGNFGIYPPGRNLNYVFSNTYKHIHWAGSETADVWKGFLEGACQSGVRAANQVSTKIKADAALLETQGTQAVAGGQKNVVTEANVQPIVDTITVGNR